MKAMHTPYARRIALAVAVSILAHATIILAFALAPQSSPVEASAPAPVRVRFEAPTAEPDLPPESVRRLIDAESEQARPEQPTDLIAELDSRARDLSTETGEDLSPSVDILDEYERIAAVPPMPEPQPEPPAPLLDALEPLEPVEREREQLDQDAEDLAEPEPRVQQTEPPEQTTEPSRPVPLRQEESEEEASEPASPEPERVEVAQAPPEPREEQPQQENPILREQQQPEVPMPPGEPSPSRSRVQGAVQNKGFLGFEAMQDDIAPYLSHIRDRVERRWRLSMELEYGGAARARAVIDCAIRSNGELAHVTVHDDGGNPGYAAACANAIRRAGPFDAFPFEVPALYRDEEIVIRWTFQFM